MNSVEKFKNEYPRVFRLYKYMAYKNMLEVALKSNRESLNSFDKPPKSLRVTSECLEDIVKLPDFNEEEWDNLIDRAGALDICSSGLYKDADLKAKAYELRQAQYIYDDTFGGPLGEIVEEAVDEFTWAYNFSVGGKHKDLNKIVREMNWINNDINFLDEWQIAK